MRRLIRGVFVILGVIAPKLGGRIAYALFFKPFRLKSHPEDLKKKKEGTQMDLSVNGNKCSAWAWGVGPAIIFAHGWNSKGFHYRKFIDPLVTSGFKVVIVDFPGHVNSEGKTTNVLEFKQTILQLSEKIGTIYGLVGHSLGGLACVLALKENVFVVDKLVISNSNAKSSTIMRRFMEQIGGNQSIEKKLRKLLKENFNHDFSYYSTLNLVKEIKQLPDTLVVTDTTDPEVPVEESIGLSEVMGAELLITEGLGHNNGLKDEKVVEQIISFLTKKNRDNPVQ